MGSPTTPVATATGYDVAFQTQNIAPPNAIYFSPDDQLFLFVVPSVVCTLRVIVRYLLPTGELKVGEYDVITVATRSPQLQIQNLGEGFLLGVNVFCHTTALRRGQVWAKFVFIRGGLNTQILTQTVCQGYVTELTGLFFPNGPGGYEFEGFGNIRSITGTVPGAGSEIIETVPSGAIWRLNSFRAAFTASATVGTRNVTLLIDDGVNVLYGSLIPLAVTAAGNLSMGVYNNIQVSTFSTNAEVMPLPNPFYLPAGYRIRTSSGILAGDQWTAPQYQVEEWLQP